MKTAILLALTILLLACVLASCNYQVTGYDTQPKQTRAPFLDRVIVYPHWVKDVDEIVRGGHCARKAGSTDVGCAEPVQIGPADWKCDLYVQQPTDFNDAARLVVLGHEAVHCFGGDHE